jgi:perosamine synthetase
MNESYIPVYQPLLLGNEKKYVLDCLDSNWISSKGIYLSKFEVAFSDFLKVKNSACTSNGTVALHLALLAAGIGEGDEVIVPTLTYIASVNCIKYVGANVVFADSSPTTWQVDPKSIESKISNKTKAIMAVHLYGGSCDMDSILKIAEKHQLYVIEDCAEAFGTRYKNSYVGTFGHIGCFSFYGNKTITTGEGGMVVTNDQTLFDRVIHFRGQGLAAYRQYWHDTIGYNYRMTNICAAIGLAQLEQADNILIRKKEIAKIYLENLVNLPLEFQIAGKQVEHSYWMFSILTKNVHVRDNLCSYLNSKLIETRPIFYPVHTMPMYSSRFQKFNVAEDIGWRGLNLPSWPGLSNEQLLHICGSIHSFFKKNRIPL